MAIRGIIAASFFLAVVPSGALGQTYVPLFDDPADWALEGESSNDIMFESNQLTISSGITGLPAGRASRDIDVLPGDTLVLSGFYWAGGGECYDQGCPDAGGSLSVPGLELNWRIRIVTNEVGDFETMSVGDSFTHEFTFAEAGTHSLTFSAVGADADAAISVSGNLITVPEPTSALLAIMGASALVASARQRRY